MSNFLNNLEKTPVSTKPFWAKINETRNKKNSNNIPTLIKDGIEYACDESKANLFAEKLKNTFNETDTMGFDNEFKIKVDEFINNKSFDNVYTNKQAVPFTLHELNVAIKKLNNSKSNDPIGINNFIIKKLNLNSRKGLLQLYNKCLTDNSIPSEWKTAEITMLPKKANDKTDINNYRPISKTPSLAKLFERLISARLNAFLKKNKILISCQSGFRQNRQTRDNIFHLTQKVTESFNRSKKVCAIFFPGQKKRLF